MWLFNANLRGSGGVSAPNFLNLSSSNEDRLNFSTKANWVMGSDIDIEMPLLNVWSGSVAAVFDSGLPNDPNTGRVILRRVSATQYRIFLNGINGTSSSFFTINGATNFFQTIRIFNLEVFIDEVKMANIGDIAIALDSSVGGLIIGGDSENNEPLSAEIYPFKVDGENFLLTEGSGFNVTGDSSTVAVGSTINAGGLTYWDANVWTLIP